MFTSNPSQLNGIYIPNYPPPPLTIALSHDSLPNSQVDTFKSRFDHYLDNRNATNQKTHVSTAQKQIGNEKLKLCDVTDEVRESYELIDQIKAECVTLLDEKNRFTEIEWNEKWTMLCEKKKRLMDLTEKYANADVQAAIEIKLKHRQEKRSRIQKRKKETSKLRHLRIETRNEKHRMIDEWFQETAQIIENQRQRAEEDQRIERILSDVKRKKSEAAKNINLMDSLIELHRVRRIQKSLSDRCEHKLVGELASLKAQWHSAIAIYEREEQKLRKCMTSNDLYDEWQEVLFGASEGTQQNGMSPHHCLDDLIRVRTAWDAFIVTSSSFPASSIPIGWITPNERPVAEWITYKMSKQ